MTFIRNAGREVMSNILTKLATCNMHVVVERVDLARVVDVIGFGKGASQTGQDKLNVITLYIVANNVYQVLFFLPTHIVALRPGNKCYTARWLGTPVLAHPFCYTDISSLQRIFLRNSSSCVTTVTRPSIARFVIFAQSPSVALHYVQNVMSRSGSIEYIFHICVYLVLLESF